MQLVVRGASLLRLRHVCPVASTIHPSIFKLTVQSHAALLTYQNKRQCSHVADARLVYNGPLANLVRGVKIFSITSSVIALSMQPLVLTSAMQGDKISTIGLVTAGILATFTLITPLMLHFLTRQYVTHLYWHAPAKPTTFTAVSYNILARQKVMTFNRDEVTVPAVGGFLKSHEVRGRPLFMDSRMFSEQEAYVMLMGYDKPMDWELPTGSSQNTVAKDMELPTGSSVTEDENKANEDTQREKTR